MFYKQHASALIPLHLFLAHSPNGALQSSSSENFCIIHKKTAVLESVLP